MRRFIPFLKSPLRVSVIRLQGAISAGGRVGAGLLGAGDGEQGGDQAGDRGKSAGTGRRS